MAATESATLPARFPARPSCCPAGRTRSSTCRPTRASRSSAGSGATPTRSVEEIDFVELGSPEDPLGPGRGRRTAPTTSCRMRGADFDDSAATLAPEETQLRLANGRVCFNWYAIDVTIPERIGDARPDRRDGRLRGRDRRLRRGLGERRAAASRSATPAARSSAASTHRTASC